MEFKFKKRPIGITPSKGIHLPVCKTTAFNCEVVKKSSDLSDGPIVVKMKSLREDCPSQTLQVALVNGKMHMNVTNTGQGELHLHRGQNIGVVDLRWAGYFHITRDGIQRFVCLHKRFIFLNEKESQDYLPLIHTTNDTIDKTPEKNTRLDIRKTPTDGTVRMPWFNDNAKKNPYPWLDNNDPRRHMTDKEILESTMCKCCIWYTAFTCNWV